MRDPLSRSFAGLQSSQDSWLHRVRENFQQFLTPARISPSSANGAPLHLLPVRRTANAGRARTASMLTHAVLLAGILLLNLTPRVPGLTGVAPGPGPWRGLTFFPAPEDSHFGQPALGKKSGGGEEDARPARQGLFVPSSSMPLAPPRRTINTENILPVPAAVFDSNAPQFPALVTNLGIPWMKKDSDSAGQGKDHGFGAGEGSGMGDDQGPGAGQGETAGGPYANIVTLPRCAYCPDPQYTDEAREAKVQGTVTLQVLVSADGRASQIRMVKGIGLGLDERAVESIRAWKFVPAHDGAHRAVPAWVTVEAIFRLF